ncbi:MAG: hypothetical protein SFX74_09720 [Fimbriimonadaceae bacterium]|nr:hypothetical protein [Fimbriimonadaceae bacterium]
MILGVPLPRCLLLARTAVARIASAWNWSAQFRSAQFRSARFRSARFWSARIAVVGCLLGQTSVALGAWHVVILVDRSKSVGDSPAALRRAENSLAEALFDGRGPLADGEGTGSGGGLRKLGPADRISIVHYGIDTQPDANSAYKRLRNARFPNDYARVTWNRSLPRRARFLSALRPTVRTNLNVLAWAFPLGFAALRPGSNGPGSNNEPPMETVVVTLHDAELNAGGVALERQVFDRYLSSGNRALVRQAEADLDQHVTLTDRAGSLRPFVERVFRQGAKQIVVAAYFARSRTGEAEAAKLEERPILGSAADWTAPGRVSVPLDVPAGLRGRPATFRLERSRSSIDLPLDGRAATAPLDPQFAGQSQRAYLTARLDHADPLLGPTQVPVRFQAAVWVPATDAAAIAQRTRWQWLAAMAAIALAAGYAMWIFRARPIRARLWGYPGARELPTFGGFRGRDVRTSGYRLRVPIEPDAAIALIELPGPVTRALLLPRFRVRGAAPGFTSEFEPVPRATRLLTIPYVPSADRVMSVEFSRTWFGRFEQRTRLELRIMFAPPGMVPVPSASPVSAPTLPRPSIADSRSVPTPSS